MPVPVAYCCGGDRRGHRWSAPGLLVELAGPGRIHKLLESRQTGGAGAPLPNGPVRDVPRAADTYSSGWTMSVAQIKEAGPRAS